MATIDDLKARELAARADADRERGFAAGYETGEEFVRGLVDGIEDAPEHRLLTTDEAVRAAVGGATGEVAVEIAQAQRSAVEALDANMRENTRAA